MALKHLCSLVMIGVLAAGCRGTKETPAAAGPEEPEALSVTRWTVRPVLGVGPMTTRSIFCAALK